MSTRASYAPGAAAGAEVRKEGDNWTLILVRDLRHPPTKVWQALTDPAQLREWAPFDADRNLGTPGTAKLSTVGLATPRVSETKVKRAEAPRVLEYSWGENEMRWELEPQGNGTRLTITEEGEVYNPIFRFVSRFIMGHTRTIDRYLGDLKNRLG